jgi:hypothetical protein
MISVIGGYEGIFRPAAHSARRRTDAAEMRDLLWEYRSAIIKTASKTDTEKLETHDAYHRASQQLYRLRGPHLVDFGLAQRETDTRSDTKRAGSKPRVDSALDETKQNLVP